MIIAQISDTHVTTVGEKLDSKYQTAVCMERAVYFLSNLAAKPDLVVITGDCVNKGNEDEYQRLKELLRPLPMPVYLIPGNHDHRNNFKAAFGLQGTHHMADFVQYVVDDWPVRLIMLDTNIPGVDKGYLCAERLNWLSARLAEDPVKPTIIFLHHPPFASGLAVLDEMLLEGADALGEIVANYQNIERITAGHVHCAIERRFYGTIAATCPSTAHQVYLGLDKPERLSIMMSPPAALLHIWSETTGLLTHTSIIGDYGAAEEVHDGKGWLSS